MKKLTQKEAWTAIAVAFSHSCYEDDPSLLSGYGLCYAIRTLHEGRQQITDGVYILMRQKIRALIKRRGMIGGYLWAFSQRGERQRAALEFARQCGVRRAK